MAKSERDIPANLQPRPGDYRFDLDEAPAQRCGGCGPPCRTMPIPPARWAPRRAGSGVVIRDGLVLTMGYLIMEAESVWLSTIDGQVLPPATRWRWIWKPGSVWCSRWANCRCPVCRLATATRWRWARQALLAGAGGRAKAIETRVVGRQEFAGYWEYLIDDALFTAPGAPVLGRRGPDWGRMASCWASAR